MILEIKLEIKEDKNVASSTINEMESATETIADTSEVIINLRKETKLNASAS